MKNIVLSFKLVFLTMGICCLAYPLLILAAARTITPYTADGSLLTNAAGQLVGSRLIAQRFSNSRYFWPRPSAVGYDGQGAGGSNLAPTNPELTRRANDQLRQYDASPDHLAPADLVSASGSGLDPHISEAAAYFQVARVAAARGLTSDSVAHLVNRRVFPVGGPWATNRIVNVLELNLALDTLD